MAAQHRLSFGGAAGYVGAFAVLAVFFFTLGGGANVDPLGGVLLLLMGVALGLGFSAFLKRGAREAEREFREHYLDALEDDEDKGS
jgi:hypothetical protein